MKTLFAPIPPRAYRDARLHERHFKLLILIAMYDRLNRRGGCFTSLSALAKLLAWDKGDVSRVASDLQAYGYIDAKQVTRKGCIRNVVYTDDDHRWMQPNSSHQHQPKGWPPIQPSEGDGWHRGQQMVGKSGLENDASPSGEGKNSAEAYASKHIRKIEGATDEADGAETQRRKRRLPVEDPERYLHDVEALAAAGDTKALKVERPLIEELAGALDLTDGHRQRFANLLPGIDAKP